MKGGILVLCLTGCGGPVQGVAPAQAEPHLKEAWFAHRAESLGIEVEAAKARDAAFSESEPPDDAFWDATMQVEAAVIWRKSCAPCHGIEGRLESTPPMDPPPKEWGGMGPQMGFFFGGDKMRAGIYRKIRDGGDSKEDGSPPMMPPWGQVLSREQMWGLVQHIEGF